MSQHLSLPQIDEWIVGERTQEVEAHLRSCDACAEQVRRAAEPLKMFASAVRTWSGEQRSGQAFIPPVDRDHAYRWSGVRRLRAGRISLAIAAVVMMIAVSVYRNEQSSRRAAVTAVQDEIMLRQVEAGISRSIPAPMEPLAKLMSSDSSR